MILPHIFDSCRLKGCEIQVPPEDLGLRSFIVLKNFGWQVCWSEHSNSDMPPPTPRERSITFWRPQATCSIHSDLHITYRHYYFLFDYSYLHFSSKSTKKGSITAFAKTIDDRTTQWSMRINDPELSDDPFSRNRRWMSCYCTGDDMMDREVTIGTAMLIDYGCKHK